MSEGREICKKCGVKLIQKATKHTPSQLKKPYYYTAYYFCPKCHRLYHDDKFKVINNLTNLLPLNLIEPEKVHFDAEIWTDGACVFNGRENARAAWSFVSGKTEKAGLVQGKQTNNIAEALAIYYALVWAAEQGFKVVKIYSDSQITINNLRKKTILINKNREIFELITGIITANNLKVEYKKVIGHSGDINNERADKLANGMAGKE